MRKVRYLSGLAVFGMALALAGCSSAGADTSAIDGGGPDQGGGSDQIGVAAPITSLTGTVPINDTLGTLSNCSMSLLLVAPGPSFPERGTTFLAVSGDGSFTFDLPTPLDADLWPIDDFPFARLIDPVTATGISISDTSVEFAFSQSLPTSCTYDTDAGGTIADSGSMVGVTGDSSAQEIWIYSTDAVTLSGSGTATGLDGSGPGTKTYNVTVDIVLVSGWNRLTVTRVDSDTYDWYSGARNSAVVWKRP